jgi:transposase-like protein
MAKDYPADLRRDVAAVARQHEAPLVHIAKDFGISNATRHNWLKKADVEDGVRPGLNDADGAEIRALKKRARLLEQENEILRRAAIHFAKDLSPK